MDWHVPLAVATLVFLAFMVWRMRPAFLTERKGRPTRLALREARQRVDAAKTDEERAAALCDAADACASAIGRSGSAVGYYLRAMRVSPSSADLVERAATGLARRPHALESLLWRRLGAEPWTGAARPATIAALRHLAALYAGPLHQSTRARALEHALAAIETGVTTISSTIP